MSDEALLSRIVVHPGVMGGKPVIRGTRLTVQYILKMLADGVTPGELENEYGGLSREDVAACLLHASTTLDDPTFIPGPASARHP